MKKIKYLTFRMGSCFNRVIELNLKMLILRRLMTKFVFVHVMIKKTDFEYLQKLNDKMFVIY
jgi:hypothetical protein